MAGASSARVGELLSISNEMCEHIYRMSERMTGERASLERAVADGYRARINVAAGGAAAARRILARTSPAQRAAAREPFCANLARVLAERNMSQADLAKAAGLSQAAVSKYLSGKADPRLSTLLTIADAAGCDVGELLK